MFKRFWIKKLPARTPGMSNIMLYQRIEVLCARRDAIILLDDLTKPVVQARLAAIESEIKTSWNQCR